MYFGNQFLFRIEPILSVSECINGSRKLTISSIYLQFSVLCSSLMKVQKMCSTDRMHLESSHVRVGSLLHVLNESAQSAIYLKQFVLS